MQEYYGSVLKSSRDLKTNACCTSERVPAYVQPLLEHIHEQVHDTYYGCGFPVPPALSGTRILDLGCGSGRDVYLLSQLSGTSGSVTGIDMTKEQLTIARSHVAWHQEQCPEAAPVRFLEGYIEDLAAAGVASGAIDVVVSNCVINLSPRKDAVFKEVHRVLAPGGEFYFSDVYASRRIPAECLGDPVLRGECLSGALYLEDFRRMMATAGFNAYQIVSSQPLIIEDVDIKKRLADVEFYSMTIRALSLDLEDREEDYGHRARYLGTLPECPELFVLDMHQQFTAGSEQAICGNTARILQDTRYAPYFEVQGDFSQHRGLFTKNAPKKKLALAPQGCC